MRDRLIDNILKLEYTYLTGHRTKRLPNNASFRFSFIEGESIILQLNDVASLQYRLGMFFKNT